MKIAEWKLLLLSSSLLAGVFYLYMLAEIHLCVCVIICTTQLNMRLVVYIKHTHTHTRMQTNRAAQIRMYGQNLRVGKSQAQTGVFAQSV